MSHAAIVWAFAAKCPSPSAKLVLLVLADAHNSKTDECFPTIGRIVETTGLSESGVKLAVRLLEAAGLVTRESVKHENGRTKGVFYTLHFEGRGHSVTPQRGHSVTGEGAASDPSRGHPVPPSKAIGKEVSGKVSGNQERAREPVRRRHDWPEDYREQVWSAYPKRTGKKAGIERLEALHRSDEIAFETIFAGIKRLARHTEPRFCPELERWLRKERWNDEYPATGPPAGRMNGHERPKTGAAAYLAVARRAHEDLMDERHAPRSDDPLEGEIINPGRRFP